MEASQSSRMVRPRPSSWLLLAVRTENHSHDWSGYTHDWSVSLLHRLMSRIVVAVSLWIIGDAWATSMTASGQSTAVGAGKKRGNSCSDAGSSIRPSSGSIEAIDVEDEGEKENEDDQASKRSRLLATQSSSSAGASSFSVSSRRAASCEVIEIDDD